jgi:4-alpha-glucanotransferase
MDHRFTGVAAPVASLRTRQSCGVGEFADLVDLGKWCAGAGLELIQLLPVNDTGGNSSPYSALSAFALHPLYVRLQALPGAQPFAKEIAEKVAGNPAESAAGGRFSYGDALQFKLSVMERIFQAAEKSISRDPELSAWRAANPWVTAYAVFSALKKRSQEAPWSTWGVMADPSPDQISGWWETHPTECLPYAWVQFQLEAQLTAASRALESMGIALKGDLPILMSRESADVWAYRRFFDLTAVAGAPPDMFSPEGQNWGFPVYDWERLEAEDCAWWKDRLRQAGKFFHAFRIDHVLGFFRIWRIPRGERTGLLGRFSPSFGLTKTDLTGLGFDKERVRWLSLPHVSGAELAAALGPEAPRARERYLTGIGAEDLYNLKPEIDHETVIDALDEPHAVKRFLLSWHGNRTLLDDGTGLYYPHWYIESTKGFQSLSAEEKSRLTDLLGKRRAESEAAWEKHGRELLDTLRRATDMLVCAEDLGDVPRCVPRVLASLGILSLRILRWSREYERTPPGVSAAFILPDRFPELSVCTPSVHDTSTIRGWWEEEQDRELFYRALGASGPCPPHMTAHVLTRIVEHCLSATSRICVFQLQDLLDLDQKMWSADPREDRINVPGTVNDLNWTWRMPLAVEQLLANNVLSAAIRASVQRRARGGRSAAG